MSKVKLERLLDLDGLSHEQKTYLKSLITYEFLKRGKFFNIVVKNNKGHAGKYGFGWPVREKWISLISYKHIMFHLIDTNCGKIKDPVVIQDIKDILTRGAEFCPQDQLIRDIKLGGVKVGIRWEIEIRSQDLFRALELVMGATSSIK